MQLYTILKFVRGCFSWLSTSCAHGYQVSRAHSCHPWHVFQRTPDLAHVCSHVFLKHVPLLARSLPSKTWRTWVRHVRGSLMNTCTCRRDLLRSCWIYWNASWYSWEGRSAFDAIFLTQESHGFLLGFIQPLKDSQMLEATRKRLKFVSVYRLAKGDVW